MVTYIVEDLKSSIESSIKEQLSGENVNIPDISHCFEGINPFQGLETEHKQIKFYKDNFSLVVSHCMNDYWLQLLSLLVKQ